MQGAPAREIERGVIICGPVQYDKGGAVTCDGHGGPCVLGEGGIGPAHQDAIGTVIDGVRSGGPIARGGCHGRPQGTGAGAPRVVGHGVGSPQGPGWGQKPQGEKCQDMPE